MASEGRRDRILERFGKLIDAPENRSTAAALQTACDAYEAGETGDADTERLLDAYEQNVQAEREEQDKKRGVAKPYTKFFRDDSSAFAALSFKAKALHATLQKPPVDPDGTVARLKPGEMVAPDKAIFRSLGISGPERRSFRDAAKELLEAGFLCVEGDRVKLPHWETRQAWKKGTVPAPVCEPEARFKYPDKTEARPKSNQSPTKARPKLDRNPTEVEPSKEPNPSESLDAGRRNGGHTPSLLFASKGGTPFSLPPKEGPEKELHPSEKKGRVAPSARPPRAETDPPYDSDADDGYGDRDFLDEACPGDVHLRTESERVKWKANRRPETSRATAALAAKEIANG